MESGRGEIVQFEKDIKACIVCLRAGGVILYPTDTIWGLGCDATNAAAIAKIFQIKHRSPSKSMIILARDAAQVAEYVYAPSAVLLHEMKMAQRPTTAIFERARNLPDNLINDNGSVAVRIPSEKFCQALLSAFPFPIVSTSANISQHATPQNFSQIDPELLSLVDYTVFYRRADNAKKEPSHIIRLDDGGKIIRIR